MVEFSIDFGRMVPHHVLALGIDALVTYLSRFIHSEALIRKKLPKDLPTMWFTNLKVFRLKKKTVSRSWLEYLIFSSPIFSNVEVHAVRKYRKVTQ